MQIIEVQFAPWDQTYFFQPVSQTGQELDLKEGDRVVVETSLGVDLGRVVNRGELNSLPTKLEEIKPVIRQADEQDRLKFLELNQNNNQLFKDCSNLIKQLGLEMKLVDVQTSFDNQRITFAFIADGRVDFRYLVKELIKKHHKVVRMQQIGVRDEAKLKGDTGSCGRPLCCRGFLKELGNVSTDYAKCQQVAGRGSDRLSGVCSRLKCCLRYEQPVYEELAKGFPEIGSSIKTRQGSGVVTTWYPLRGTVGVALKGQARQIEVEVGK